MNALRSHLPRRPRAQMVLPFLPLLIALIPTSKPVA